jgi:hypothetical protein
MADEEWVWHGKRKRSVYAVVRVDHEFLNAEAPGTGPSDGLDGVTVTQVLPTAEEAASEVRRLNALGADRGHVPQTHAYYWMATRYFPDGRAGTSQEDDPSD